MLCCQGSLARKALPELESERPNKACRTEKAPLAVPLSCPALRHSSRSSAPTIWSSRPAVDSSFPDVHSAMSADEQLAALHACDSPAQLLQSSAMPVLVGARVLCLDGCATAAARGAVAVNMVRVSRDARTEAARRRRAHGRAQKPQDVERQVGRGRGRRQCGAVQRGGGG